MRDVRRADEADRADVGMVEDRIDHFLVAVDGLENAFGHAGFEEEFGQANRDRGVALAGLQDEGVAGRGRDAAHP